MICGLHGLIQACLRGSCHSGDQRLPIGMGQHVLSKRNAAHPQQAMSMCCMGAMQCPPACYRRMPAEHHGIYRLQQTVRYCADSATSWRGTAPAWSHCPTCMHHSAAGWRNNGGTHQGSAGLLCQAARQQHTDAMDLCTAEAASRCGQCPHACFCGTTQCRRRKLWRMMCSCDMDFWGSVCAELRSDVVLPLWPDVSFQPQVK